MNEIERAFGQRITRDVVTTHLDVWERDLVQQTDVDVGDQNPSSRADPLAEPSRDRSATAADFQAAPSRRHSAVCKMPLGGRIEERGQGGESGRGIAYGIHRRLHSTHKLFVRTARNS